MELKQRLMHQNLETPLLLACWVGYADVVRLLLDLGSPLSDRNKNGNSSLLWACRLGHMDIVRLLLDRESCLLDFNNDGETPLLLACWNGHLDIIKLLLDRGSSLSDITNDGNTPLLLACRGGHVNVVKFLLDQGLSVSDRNKDGVTPLFMASKGGHKELVDLLLTAGAGKEFENACAAAAAAEYGVDEEMFKNEFGERYDAFIFDSFYGWAGLNNDVELVKRSLGAKRVSFEYLAKVKHDFATLPSQCTGCKIPLTEHRGITIRQLQMVMNEIYNRCVVEKWEGKRYKSDGTIAIVPILPQEANLYDIIERVIKKLTKEKDCSFVELLADAEHLDRQIPRFVFDDE
eukprot:gene6318-8703_t